MLIKFTPTNDLFFKEINFNIGTLLIPPNRIRGHVAKVIEKFPKGERHPSKTEDFLRLLLAVRPILEWQSGVHGIACVGRGHTFDFPDDNLTFFLDFHFHLLPHFILFLSTSLFFVFYLCFVHGHLITSLDKYLKFLLVTSVCSLCK